MKRLLLLFLLTTSITFVSKESFGQKISEVYPTLNKSSESIGLRPEDGNPSVFTTQEELNEVAPKKMAMLKEMIDSGKYSGDRLRVLREDYWRFENAIVAPK